MRSRLLGCVVLALSCSGIGCSRAPDEKSERGGTTSAEDPVEAHAPAPTKSAAETDSEPRDKGPQVSTESSLSSESPKPAELLAKQKLYLEAWRVRKRSWDAAGMSAEAQEIELARLKQSILEK
jgi:hypothetical protein